MVYTHPGTGRVVNNAGEASDGNYFISVAPVIFCSFDVAELLILSVMVYL